MDIRQFSKYFFLFIIAFLLFSYFQYSPTFPDPDSFYHAKMAVLLRDQGIVRDFPWLQFTVLKDYYIDHHFLYHVTLVPFVTFLDPLVGIKLATAFFAALLILTFYWLLIKLKNRGAFFYSLVLLASSPFIFRINLAKASAPSIIFLLLGIYFIFNRRHWPFFFLSFAYVWLFDGWPLILILTLFYIIADSTIKSIDSPTSGIMNYEPCLLAGRLRIKKLIENCKLKIENFIKNLFAKENIKLFFSCLGGLIAGVIINPYFPKNLYFYWYHIIKIAIINYKDKIGVGAEWYPYGFGDLIANAPFVFVLLALSFFVLFIKFLEKSSSSAPKINEADFDEKKYTLTAILITIFFLILTLRSRRNVEYFIPFAVFFSALVLKQALSRLENYWTSFSVWRQKRKVLASALCLYFLIAIPFIVGRDIWSVKKLFSAGYPLDKYKEISEWLKNNTPENSLIFHNDWDDFPPLFYHNTHNRYIAGLDPTFMYDYNQKLYREWVDITTAREKNISQIIKTDFGANYVFVDKDHPALDNNLRSDNSFILVYKDDEGKIYQLINL